MLMGFGLTGLGIDQPPLKLCKYHTMAAVKKVQKGRERRRRKSRKPSPMVFTQKDYILIVVGIVVVIIGYTIMRIENEVDGFISLNVAPILILGGYLEVMYAIFYREKPAEDGA